MLCTGKVTAVVIDGITIGHPCCGRHNCHRPLLNNRDRFCDHHKEDALICCITTCQAPVVTGSKVCEDPVHIAIQTTHVARGQARFQLQRLLNEARAVSTDADTVAGDIDIAEDEYELNSEGRVIVTSDADLVQTTVTQKTCPDKPETGNKQIRAQFGRRRTHNEQVIVSPCGVIIARVTFYGAEAIGTVAVSKAVHLLYSLNMRLQLIGLYRACIPTYSSS